MSSGICGQRGPRSACASGQSYQGLCFPQTYSSDKIKCLNGEQMPRWVIAHVQDDVSTRGWPGVAKVSCILRHRGVQMRLTYSWTRPVILVAGKGWGECSCFFCFFTFIPVPSLSLSFNSSTVSSISFLPHKMTHKDWRVVKSQLNQCESTHFAHARRHCFLEADHLMVGCTSTSYIAIPKL